MQNRARYCKNEQLKGFSQRRIYYPDKKQPIVLGLKAPFININKVYVQKDKGL